MTNNKISVIIPVYNAEKYLDRCIDSIINQTYKNIEIILVNDGSKDNSLNICKKYQKLDKRIKLINKKNEGVSIARNKGIEIATGEYLYFCDADDYLDIHALEYYYKEIQNSDLIISDYYIVNENKNIKKSNSFPKNIRIDTIKEIDNLKISLLSNSYKHSNILNGDYTGEGLGFVWNKLFRKSIVDKNNIRFPKGIILCEDVCFIYKYLDNCKKIKLINKPLYYHEIINTGATLRYKPEIIDSERTFIDETWYITKSNNTNIIEAYYARLIRMLSWDFMFYIFHKDNKNNKNSLIKKMFNEIPEYKKAIKNAKYRHLTKKQSVFLFLMKTKQYWIISKIIR